MGVTEIEGVEVWLAHFAKQHVETSPAETQKLVPRTVLPATSELKPGLQNREWENKKQGALFFNLQWPKEQE